MNYLNPQIAQLVKKKPQKTLVNKGISCGIFQDVGKDPQQDVFRQKIHNS